MRLGQGYSLKSISKVSNFEQTRPRVVFTIALSATREFKWKFCLGMIHYLLKVPNRHGEYPNRMVAQGVGSGHNRGNRYAEQRTQDSSGR
jgi:hypothetical protein